MIVNMPKVVDDGPDRAMSKSGIPQQPTSDESEVSDVAGVAEESQETAQNLTSGLPFSKARCIALVVTLTGSSFLNVSRGFRRRHNGHCYSHTAAQGLTLVTRACRGRP